MARHRGGRRFSLVYRKPVGMTFLHLRIRLADGMVCGKNESHISASYRILRRNERP